MSQIARGHCIEEFATRPELNPSWFGKITPIPRAQAPCNEISRRSDGLIAKFFSGTPKLASARRDQWGLSANYTPSYKSEQTSEGSMQLPIEYEKLHFLPSVATLEVTAHRADTRLQPFHPRYF